MYDCDSDVFTNMYLDGIETMIARRITSIIPIPSSRIGCAGRHYSVLLQDKIDIVPKKKKEEKNIWKLAILEELKEELRVERQQYSKKYKRRLGQAQIVRYAMVSDLPSIISYAHKYILEVSSIDTAEDDEFISISLLLLQRDIRRMLNSKEDLNSRETFATFFLFAKMWDRIQILGPNTGSVTILLLDTLDRWSHMRKKDDKSSEIDKILLRIRKRLMDNELTLLSHFREPFPEENYHGNQYKLDEIQKEEYLRRFPTQLATEKIPWLRVENFGKSRKEGISMSAEQLIESWDWKGRIECSLERMRKDQIQNTLKGYLSILSISELSTLILESVLAVCSQGQEFIQFSLFQYSLVSPLIQLIHNKFIERVGVDEKEVSSNYFEIYFEGGVLLSFDFFLYSFGQMFSQIIFLFLTIHHCHDYILIANGGINLVVLMGFHRIIKTTLNFEPLIQQLRRVQARPVFDALNQLGATPWKINEPMLDVLCQVFTLSGDPTKAELLEKLSIPMRGDTVTIPNSTVR
uniref:HECT domain-containing protein n=1 Tax=Heterorhabditis bacteriophora TaxID=37862 RepID=A0A1I7X5E5_HETBA